MPKGLMQSVANQLQKERIRLEDELRRVTAALVAIGGVYRRGRNSNAALATRKKHRISAAGRRRIAAAQKARWAKVRARQKKAA
jgi:hypothetical protein